MFARVTVPFEAPTKLYIRPGFGAVVEQGDGFTVLLCSGKVIEL